MKTFDKVLENIERWIGIIFVFAMALAILLQVVFRLAEFQVSWTEELARYMFISITYYGSVYAFRKHKHLKVEVLESFVGEKGKFILRLITNISSIIFCVIITYIMFKYFAYLSTFKQMSPVMHIDIRIVYFAPLLFGILSLYELVKDTIIVIKKREV